MAFGDFFKGSSEPPTQQSVDRRRRIAQALASVGQMGLQGSGSGRSFRAPSTGASIAGALSQIVGGYQSGKAEQEQKTVDEDRKRKIAEALTKVQGGQQNQAAMEALQTLPLEQQEAALAQGVSGKLFSKPKLERVDLGDAIGVVDEAGQVVQRIPKGIAPSRDRVDLGDRIGVLENGQLAGQFDKGIDPTQERSQNVTMRGQDLTAATTTRGQDVTIRGQDLAAQTAATKTPAGGNVTGEERTAAYLAARLDGALQDLKAIEQTAPGSGKPGVIEKAAGGMFGETGANLMRDGDRQRANATQLDALDAALTLATGAAYTKEQLAGQAVSYFPQIGDDDATIADKQRRFEALVQAARIKAGRAAPQIDQANQQRQDPQDWQNGNNPQGPRSRIQAADPFMGKYLP